MATTTKVATYIHGVSQQEQNRLALLNDLTNKDFLRFIKVNPKDHVLEVGCGTGALTAAVASMASHGKVFGIDLTHEQIDVAKRWNMTNLNFQVADATRLPYEMGKYDVVYCRYLLEHMADPSQVLTEMQRVLKAEGRIYIQENNIAVLDFDPDCPKFMSLWKKFAILQEKLGGDAFIGKRLSRLLKAVGFRKIEISIHPEVHVSGEKTYRNWLDNLIGNVRGAQEHFLAQKVASAQEVSEAIAELEAMKSRQDGSVYFYWNRASAVK